MANTFGVQQGNPRQDGAWSTGLCDCFADAGGCCLTLFCPCVTFGRIARIVDQGAISGCKSGTLYVLLSAATGMGCLYSCCYRAKIRRQYGIAEEPCGDCCVHWCCEPCALCQEYRELKARGFDMSRGWDANMEKMAKAAGGGAAATAPGQMYMSR